MRASELIQMLVDSRRRTLELAAGLASDHYRAPLIPIVNPPVWELGHVAWFQEKWALRRLRGEAPLRADGDSFWDSSAVAHDDRWQLPLPNCAQTHDYMQRVMDRVLDRLSGQGEVSTEEAYFHWLAAMHEDMHGEAFLYTRQTLGFGAPWPCGDALETESCEGDVDVTGCTYMLGATPGKVFVFDNEKWAHPVAVEPFRIARAAVTNAQFAGFVDDNGYRRRDLWSDEGWAWRESERAEHPVYWVREGGTWLRRRFDQVVSLEARLPVIHVNWYEAEAYCRWAGRRLPAEAEWELAASSPARREFPWGGESPGPARANLDGASGGCVAVGALPESDSGCGCRQLIGNVWEWTATDFLPYPGFVVDPYKEYSEPWFGSERKVLRGGCWATRSRLISNTWRNYFTKERRDIFAGFRTCAAQPA